MQERCSLDGVSALAGDDVEWSLALSLSPGGLPTADLHPQ